MPQTQTHEGITLDYDVQGAGEPLLLVAGLSAERSFWGYVREDLNQRFKTIAFDNRDAGKSGLAQRPYGYADQARDALAVMDASGVTKAHVLGHSMGGVIVQELALLAPERISSLIIANSYAQNDLHTTEHFKLAQALRRGLDNDHTFMSALYFYGLGRGTLSQMPLSAVATSVLEAGPVQDRQGFIRQCDVLLTTDTVARLPAIAAPTLVIWSPEDKFFTQAQSATIADAIPGSVLQEAAGTGHCPMVENPPGFVASIADFVDKLEG